MKTKIVSLFLKREHLILLSKMLLITDNTTDQDTQIQIIDSRNQKSENRILKTERWPQQDLDYFQNSFLQIANLIFSYFKFHFPANSALQIKEHIKFIHVVKQINFGGVTIEEVFKQQRTRLNLEISKITKSIKLIDEPIMPKIINTKIDLSQIQAIQDNYFFPKNNDFMTPYLILNLKQHIPKIAQRYYNKELQQSITSLEDIPPFQFMNSNLIQPILNYESLKNGFEYKFNKLMQRNSLVQYTIKRYQSKIKQFEFQSENSDIEHPLQNIKILFCFQIKQQYENKINQNLIIDNKFPNQTNCDNSSFKITPSQTIKDFESVILNQNKEAQEFKDIFPGSKIYQQQHEFNISQKFLLDSITKNIQTQRNLEISEKESIYKLNPKLIKSSLKSLDLRQSELINENTSRLIKKNEDQKIQENTDNQQSNHKFLFIPHQTIEPSIQKVQLQNTENQQTILTNRNPQQKSLDRITLKPLAYQSARLKEIKVANRDVKDSSFPYLKDSLPNIGVAIFDSEYEKLKGREQKFSFQGGLQKRLYTNEKGENSIKEISDQKKKCNLKNQLQNQLNLLTRSEQIITTLMSNGQIRGTELYQQLLQPIKIHSSAKFLTPKSDNLISRSKFRNIQQEGKIFSLK